MPRLFRTNPRPRRVQRSFAFRERWLRRVRGFKRGIVAATVLTAAVLVAASPRGRYLAVGVAEGSRQLARRAVGVRPGRAEVDAEWARYRRQGVADTSREFRRVFDELDPAVQRLMRYAGNDPEAGLFRWANFDQTLLLPSTVFEPDDAGRSYRLRPNTRAVWLRSLSIQGIPLTFFLVPDGPGLADAMRGTAAIPVPGSTQTTNSWGLRGPEPDPTAPVRGIVLGDSFMQGHFVGDSETPPECLRRVLQCRLNRPVSVLNTGHLGYSPEQEYFTLREYADRFRPRFVVLSLFANDFGPIFEVAAGKGDWDEGKYWLERIERYCRDRRILLLHVPAPLESLLTARRMAGHYPGRISNLLESPGLHDLDPADAFMNSHLELMSRMEREGRRPQTSPLFNGAIGDGHFSAAGCEVWAAAVGERLALLIQQERQAEPAGP